MRTVDAIALMGVFALAVPALADDDIYLEKLREPTSQQQRQDPWDDEVVLTSNPEMIEGCEFLGPVKQSINLSGLWSSTGKKKAERWLKRNVWEAYGDTVFIAYMDGGYWKKQEVAGEAYRCDDHWDEGLLNVYQSKRHRLNRRFLVLTMNIEHLRREYQETHDPATYERLEAVVVEYREIEAQIAELDAKIVEGTAALEVSDPLLDFDN